MYVLKNEDGNQYISSEIKDSDNIIGLWKFKSVKYKFIHDIVSKMEYKGNPFLEETYKANVTYMYVSALNNFFKKKEKEKKQKYFYQIVLTEIAKLCPFDKYITIPKILKHFQQTEIPVDKKLLIEMSKNKLLRKVYQRITITSLGWEYIK